MYEAFAAAVGRPFNLPCGTELLLDRVSEPVEQAGFVTWSLLFRGPGDRPLEQGTHTVVNDELGDQAIFLVPVGQVDGGLEYEAVFSRRSDGEQP